MPISDAELAALRAEFNPPEPEPKPGPHPMSVLLRELREARGWSLSDFERHTGIKAIVIGSYERGDRTPTFDKLDRVLRHYGYELRAVPMADADAQSPAAVAATLRHIADRIERGDG